MYPWTAAYTSLGRHASPFEKYVSGVSACCIVCLSRPKILAHAAIIHLSRKWIVPFSFKWSPFWCTKWWMKFKLLCYSMGLLSCKSIHCSHAWLCFQDLLGDAKTKVNVWLYYQTILWRGFYATFQLLIFIDDQNFCTENIFSQLKVSCTKAYLLLSETVQWLLCI